jgi:hypothetical protein
MQAALVATLARPEWWAMALAAFLVRGGVVLVIIPIISVPTVAGLITAFAPTVEGVLLGRPSLEGAVIGSVTIALVLAGLVAAGLAGSWLDLALVREATSDEDVDPGWVPVRSSARGALAIRVSAHLPTILAIAYGFIRVVGVAYGEFTSPSDAGPVTDRVFARVPDVAIVVFLAWLAGETVGSLAARRAAAGMAPVVALATSVRQVGSPRGLATVALTSAVIAGLVLPFALAANRAWEHLRGYLLDGAEQVQLWAALVLLVATWILGLAVIGAGLAWRATAWTAEVDPAPMPASRDAGAGRP